MMVKVFLMSVRCPGLDAIDVSAVAVNSIGMLTFSTRREMFPFGRCATGFTISRLG